MKQTIRVLFFTVVFAAIVFGAYQMFFDHVDASLFRCDWNHECPSSGANCSDTLTCECMDIFGGTSYKCQGVFNPIE